MAWCDFILDPLEEGETIYEAAFKDDKENKSPDEKYPSFHRVDSQKKNDSQQSSPKKSQQKHKKHHKAHKPSPLEGIEEKISKVCIISNSKLFSLIFQEEAKKPFLNAG